MAVLSDRKVFRLGNVNIVDEGKHAEDPANTWTLERSSKPPKRMSVPSKINKIYIDDAVEED